MQWQREQQTSHGRAKHACHLEDGRAPGNCIDEMMLRHQMRQQRGAGRAAKGSSRSDEKEHGVDGQNIARARPGQKQQRPGTEALQAVAG